MPYLCISEPFYDETILFNIVEHPLVFLQQARQINNTYRFAAVWFVNAWLDQLQGVQEQILQQYGINRRLNGDQMLALGNTNALISNIDQLLVETFPGLVSEPMTHAEVLQI